MKTVATALDAATHAQLKDFAEVGLGLALGSKPLSREQILAKVRAASPGLETIDVQAPADPVGFPAGTPPQPTAANDEDALVAGGYQQGDKLVIQIEVGSEKGGEKPVFVAVNGVNMLIERGKPQAVGLPYVEALENAIQTLYTQDPVTGEITSRDAPIYPFRVLRQRAA